MSETKLNPCPRCGSLGAYDQQHETRVLWQVCCNDCQIRTAWWCHLKDAIADWNKPYPSQRSDLLEAAEEVVDNYCTPQSCDRRCDSCDFGDLKVSVENARGGKSATAKAKWLLVEKAKGEK